MRPGGTHVLLELRGCTNSEPEEMEAGLRQAAAATGATVLAYTEERFEPQGCTALLLLSESHLAVHTWPEHGYVAADLFTCGDCMPHEAIGPLRALFGAAECEIKTIRRS